MTVKLNIDLNISSTLKDSNKIVDEIITHIAESVNGVILLNDNNDDILINSMIISKETENT